MFSLQLLLMMLYSCLIINAAPSTVSLDSSIVIESSPTIISQTIGTLESASEILEPSLSSMYLHPTPSSTPAVPIPESTKDVKLYDPFGMKYLLVESGTVVSEGSSDHLTTFTVEKYLNKTSNDYYYKLKVQNSSEYVYFTDSMELKVGIPSGDKVSDKFKRTEIYMYGKLGITLRDTSYDCYIGFKTGMTKRGFCSKLKRYLIQVDNSAISG